MSGEARTAAHDLDTGFAAWAQAVLARQALQNSAQPGPAPLPPVPAHGRFDHLAEVLSLSDEAHTLLALLYGLWLSPGSHPPITAARAAEILSPVHTATQSEAAPGQARSLLAGWDLLRDIAADATGPLTMVLDETIGDWLQGGDPIPALLRERMSIRRALPTPADWPLDDAVRFLQQSLAAGRDGPAMVEISGPEGSGRRSFATALGAAVSQEPLLVDLSGLSLPDAAAAVRLAERAAMLSMRPLVWIGAADVPMPEGRPRFPIQMEVLPPGKTPLPRHSCARHPVSLGPLSLAARTALWQQQLPAHWTDADIQRLAKSKPVNLSQLVQTALLQPATVDQAIAAIGVRMHARLNDTIRVQKSGFDWDDLVLPPPTLAALQRLQREIDLGDALWQSPALSRLFPQGRGVFALFSGPSGTGKTMAAQVIAAALNQDLYVVDSGAVISKYVGETAQNLQHVLAQADADAALLFFDECDGLFSKRTDARDAHDRYLNADTNILLKAVEDYRGACILASNRKDNIDSAFLRRLRYVIDFTSPDTALRLSLWKRLVLTLTGDDRAASLSPLLTGLSEQLEFTGAQIKNAVRTAWIEARTSGRHDLTAADLLVGAEHELMKEGRALSVAETERLRRHV